MSDNYNQSSAAKPDLDWSQVRETVKMLNLAVAHVSNSMHDGEESVGKLGNSFTSMGSEIFIIKEIIENNKDKVTESDYEALQEKCALLNQQIQSAIVTFQFFDRVSQQLDHVCFSLDSLSDIVSDQTKLYHPYEWNALQNQIRSTYNMDRQREIFDQFMEGVSKEELIEKLKEQKGDEASEIEMF